MASKDAVTLLRALGQSGAREAIATYARGGAKAIAPLFDALLKPPKLPKGDPPVNGRAYFEDEEDCLRTLSRAHPRAFVREVKRRPALLERLPVLSCIAEVQGPTTAGWLMDALKSRSGSLRWLAVEALARREEPQLTGHLGKLLRDRDSLVVFATIGACRRLGSAEHMPLLVEVCEKPNLGIGAREAAFDALEMLGEREGVPLPPIHPGKRLAVLRGSHPELRITEFLTTATQVPRGQVIAQGGGVVLKAPVAGVISFMDQRGDALEVGIRRLKPKE